MKVFTKRVKWAIVLLAGLVLLSVASSAGMYDSPAMLAGALFGAVLLPTVLVLAAKGIHIAVSAATSGGDSA